MNASATARIDAFTRWYSAAGHWIYDTRSEAAETWITRGIVGKDAAPADARALLADWIAADTMPALIAKLRADETAAKAAT